ncbi:MAG TPA: site-specific DNA-methyltransferase, partial [Gelidibacter sp.]|uniref:site-specific DNA-methyltransferase n=1 Tax=Gelidibacter sp. TaxID=2018083 RepID=UPI002B76B922
RFPANVIHDGSDEVVSLFPYTESGKMTSQHQRHTDGSPNGIYGKFDVNHPLGETYGDSGSAARFFYTAKASKEERNFGLYDFEKDVVTDGRTKPIDNAFNRGETKRKNIHPTVKPIELMRYLVRLVTPKNGICLDPYLGSGTTAIACEMEKFSWIGIELMPEYAEIAKARIGAVKDYEATLDTKTFIKESIKEDKEKELGIMNIFDFWED